MLHTHMFVSESQTSRGRVRLTLGVLQLFLILFWHLQLIPSGQYKIHQIIDSLINTGKYMFNLTHWGREKHICVGKLTIIASDNGLSPERRQAIIWTNAGIFLIGPLGTNVSEISIGIQTFSFKKMQLNMSSAKWHPFCLGLNVLIARNVPDDGLVLIDAYYDICEHHYDQVRILYTYIELPFKKVIYHNTLNLMRMVTSSYS